MHWKEKMAMHNIHALECTQNYVISGGSGKLGHAAARGWGRRTPGGGTGE